MGNEGRKIRGARPWVAAAFLMRDAGGLRSLGETHDDDDKNRFCKDVNFGKLSLFL